MWGHFSSVSWPVVTGGGGAAENMSIGWYLESVILSMFFDIFLKGTGIQAFSAIC